MRRFFRKNQILTIPNLLSVVRLALIPLIVWLYSYEENYYAAIGVIVLSAVTDIVDGWIARHFNMISDFGKALDPLADKLTQAALLLCLLAKYELMLGLIVIFALCEIPKFTLGIIIAKKHDEVNGAKWYGKANTVIIYATMMALILFPQMDITIATALMLLCGAVMIAAHVLYFVSLGKILYDKEKKMSRETTIKNDKNEIKENLNSPLFTGDYRRDTAVSEFEKAAEASQGIYDMIKSRKKDKSNE